MSHHYSGADFGFPLGDARLDFCDLYAFPKPGDTNRSVLIMDVHPSKALPEGSTTAEPFSPEAIYERRIDNDGDLVADIGYRFRFLPSENGVAACDGPPRRGSRRHWRGRRWGSDHRGCSGIGWCRSSSDAGRRLPLLCWLA